MTASSRHNSIKGSIKGYVLFMVDRYRGEAELLTVAALVSRRNPTAL